MMAGLLANLKGWLIGVGAVLAALALAFLKGRASGAQAERGRKALKDAEASKVSREIENDVQGLSERDTDKRLSRWLRKP
ncbi:hypothetical protein [Roseibium polysiphoniae]|uniref:hypothetical protein n=1 Tax=Roseibium polysiphoniae TaxID=2571221 RepID=UPI0032979A45